MNHNHNHNNSNNVNVVNTTTAANLVRLRTAATTDDHEDEDGIALDNNTLSWREREQRQRTLRVLMMFLMMLLFMDGDNNNNNNNNEDYSRGGGGRLRKKGNQHPQTETESSSSPLEPSVYEARIAQDALIRTIARAHPRYQDLMHKNIARHNDGEDVNEKVHQWATQQAEMVRDQFGLGVLSSEEEEEAHFSVTAPTSNRKVVVEPPAAAASSSILTTSSSLLQQSLENEQPIFHYPWNSTGFYRGEWNRLPDDHSARPPQPRMSRSSTTTSIVKNNDSSDWVVVDATALERDVPSLLQYGDMGARVVVLPPHIHLKTRDDHNLTSMHWDDHLTTATTHMNPNNHFSTYNSGTDNPSSFISGSSPTTTAAQEKENSQVQNLTLSRENGRVAFQLFSRSVPGMHELSLVDGFVKLYDSTSPGYSTRKDLLIRVRGVQFHALGRLSLVSSNVGISRTALLLSKKDDEEEAHALADRHRVNASSVIQLDASSTGVNNRDLPPWSPFVIPYPFVRDDADESIRKVRTQAYRKMPPRETFLETNSAHCEFEINLDIQPVEWSLGSLRNLITRRVKEQRKLDPSPAAAAAAAAASMEETAAAADKKSSFLTATHASLRRNRQSRAAMRLNNNALQDEALVVTMIGTIESVNCHFIASLNATALRTDWDKTTTKAVNYSFFMMIVCMTQILVLLRQLIHSQSSAAALRVSLLCIAWQTVLDALQCLAHIYLSLAMQPLFTAFASVAFFKLLIFCVIEMKYMAIIIQARNSRNGGQPAEVFRRQIAMLHLRFYVALFGTFIVAFYVGDKYRILYTLALYSFWVPQIVYNIFTEAKTPLHHYYVYGMSLSRLFFPIYMFAIRRNFLKEVYPEASTDSLLCQLLVLWVGVQTAILIAQGKYGARFMIPARFLPPKFDYSRPLPPHMLPPGALHDNKTVTVATSQFMDDRTCKRDDVSYGVTLNLPSSATSENLIREGGESNQRHATAITTRNRIRGSRLGTSDKTSISSSASTILEPQDLHHRPSSPDSPRTDSQTPQPLPTALDRYSPLSSSAVSALECSICYDPIDYRDRRQYMLAPCVHLFHRDCLLRWMDQKMECPICRTALPPT